MNMQAWDVYLYGLLINTVYYSKDCGIEYVYNSLVNHDGFNSSIKIVRN